MWRPTVKPIRMNNNRAARAERWCRTAKKRPAMRISLDASPFIAPRRRQTRFFIKFPVTVAPEHSLIVSPAGRCTLEYCPPSSCIWVGSKGGRMWAWDDPRYNASLTFETFPFPSGFDLKAKSVPCGDSLPASLKPPPISMIGGENGSIRTAGWIGRARRKKGTPGSRLDRFPRQSMPWLGRNAL